MPILVWSRNYELPFFLAYAVRARGSDGHPNICDWSTIQKLSKKGNTIKCSKQSFAQIAQASLLTTQFFSFSCIAGRVRRHGRSTTGILSRKENKLDAEIPLEARNQQAKTKHKQKPKHTN